MHVIISLSLLLGPLKAAILACLYCPSDSRSGAKITPNYTIIEQ